MVRCLVNRRDKFTFTFTFIEVRDKKKRFVSSKNILNGSGFPLSATVDLCVLTAGVFVTGRRQSLFALPYTRVGSICRKWVVRISCRKCIYGYDISPYVTLHYFSALCYAVVLSPLGLREYIQSTFYCLNIQTYWSGQIVHTPQARYVCQVKGKVVPVILFNWAPRHGGVLGEWKYSSTHYLTSTLDGGEWLASRPGSFIPRERAPGAHWIGGWVSPRDVLDSVFKRKIPSPRQESNPRTPIVQPVAQHYTDWAITALVRYIWDT
jgi:hypothetical protein